MTRRPGLPSARRRSPEALRSATIGGIVTTHPHRPVAVLVTPSSRIVLMPTPLVTVWPPELDDGRQKTCPPNSLTQHGAAEKSEVTGRTSEPESPTWTPQSLR
jgi:hypothetical protein